MFSLRKIRSASRYSYGISVFTIRILGTTGLKISEPSDQILNLTEFIHQVLNYNPQIPQAGTAWQSALTRPSQPDPRLFHALANKMCCLKKFRVMQVLVRMHFQHQDALT